MGATRLTLALFIEQRPFFARHDLFWPYFWSTGLFGRDTIVALVRGDRFCWARHTTYFGVSSRRPVFLGARRLVLDLILRDRSFFGRDTTYLALGDRSFWARHDLLCSKRPFFFGATRLVLALFLKDRSFWARHNLFWPFF